jgi:hypothetical protein
MATKARRTQRKYLKFFDFQGLKALKKTLFLKKLSALSAFVA